MSLNQRRLFLLFWWSVYLPLGIFAQTKIIDDKIEKPEITTSPKVRSKESFKAEEVLLKLAKQGDKNAQFELAMGYLIGRYAIPVDPKEGLFWLEKAAQPDSKKNIPPSPEALYYLGLCYLRPEWANHVQVKLDRNKGINYLQLAHQYGHSKSSYVVAQILLEEGKAIEAEEYLNRAATTNITGARIRYATLLLEGNLLKKNIPKAIELLEPAAIRGSTEAQLLLSDIFAGKYNSEYVDYEKMVNYLWQAAASSNQAMVRIGYCYEKGIGLPQDPAVAMQWYRRAAETEPPIAEAYLAMGQALKKGLVGPPDPAAALMWFLKATTIQNAPPIADYQVAMAYLQGEGTQSDPIQGFLFLQRSAEKGLPEAMVMIGKLWEEGKGYTPDGKPLKIQPEAIFQLYKRASEKGVPEAYYRLARCYERGYGVPQNPEEAQRYFQIARELGWPLE